MKWKNKGHEFDHIGKKMGKHKKIYIYGCGNGELSYMNDYNLRIA